MSQLTEAISHLEQTAVRKVVAKVLKDAHAVTKSAQTTAASATAYATDGKEMPTREELDEKLAALDKVSAKLNKGTVDLKAALGRLLAIGGGTLVLFLQQRIDLIEVRATALSFGARAPFPVSSPGSRGVVPF